MTSSHLTPAPCQWFATPLRRLTHHRLRGVTQASRGQKPIFLYSIRSCHCKSLPRIGIRSCHLQPHQLHAWQLCCIALVGAHRGGSSDDRGFHHHTLLQPARTHAAIKTYLTTEDTESTEGEGKRPRIRRISRIRKSGSGWLGRCSRLLESVPYQEREEMGGNPQAKGRAARDGDRTE